MRNWMVAAGIGGLMVVAAALYAGDEKTAETPDNSTASVVVVRFGKSGHAESEALMKSVVTPLRDGFLEKDVLFLDVDLSSRGSRHQAKMLLNALDMASVWKKFGSKPGTAVIIDVMEGETALEADSKTSLDKAKKAVSSILDKQSGGDEEEMPEDDDSDSEESMD